MSVPHRVLILVVCALVAETTSADTFYLTTGGSIEGDLLNPDEAPRERYLLQTEAGGKLALAMSQVDRIVVKSEAERRYDELLPALPDTVDAHWDMAERCELAGLVDARQFHLEQVLRHEPDHEAARHALNYSRVDGRWVRQDEFMEMQGYVRHRGSWRMPQEIEVQQLADRREAEVVQWRRQLKSWRSWIVKGSDRRREGEQLLRGVRDPMAVPALADMLKSEKEHRSLKLLYIDTLGQIAQSESAGESLGILAQHALYNADPKLRDASLDQLQQADASGVLAVFTAGLQHETNYIVQRAAIALGQLKARSATLPLIDALITEHKRVVGGGGGIRPMFSNQGGGLSVGGKPKIEKVKLQNEPVLHALSILHTGVNYGYNQNAWKHWYILNHTPPPPDLRRER